MKSKTPAIPELIVLGSIVGISAMLSASVRVLWQWGIREQVIIIVSHWTILGIAFGMNLLGSTKACQVEILTDKRPRFIIGAAAWVLLAATIATLMATDNMYDVGAHVLTAVVLLSALLVFWRASAALREAEAEVVVDKT